MGFSTPVTVRGPFRSPRQMLDDQSYDGHASVHDDQTAASLGLRGAPIEGPTHFSQFDPLAVTVWGPAWFEHGCISAHFQNMLVEGEQVQASLLVDAAPGGRITAAKDDGTPVLVGTASLGPEHPESELDIRRTRQAEPGPLYVVDRLEVGMQSPEGAAVVIDHTTSNGDLYPFSLAEKLAHITEPHPWYTEEGAGESPWGRAIVPMEMISVLAHKAGTHFPVRTPSLGLFLDLEIRLHDGPVFVGQPYELRHEIVGLGQSRKTESYWTRSTLTDAGSGRLTATVLLHSGVFKASYAGYPKDLLA